MRVGLSCIYFSQKILLSKLHCKTVIIKTIGGFGYSHLYLLDHRFANTSNRYVHSSPTNNVKYRKEPDPGEESRITRQGYFKADERNKENFMMTIEVFKDKEKLLRGHVEFIYAALRNMEEYGVHKDIEVYKKLMDVFPKVKMIPQNMWQVEFMHYPIQQNCAVDLLHQMEHWGVIPDGELQTLIYASFGRNSHPFKKMARMNYWMKKFNNASPWPLPKIVPNDALELAKMAMVRMCSVDHSTVITCYDTSEVEGAIDHTWIISGQSPIQQELLQNQPDDEPLKVEGPYLIYLREESIHYFTLKAAYRPPPVIEVDKDDISSLAFQPDSEDSIFPQSALVPQRSVHEQDDGTILGLCITGTSSRDSLLSWVRVLTASNPRLGEGLPVVFLQASPSEADDLVVTQKETSLINKESTNEKENAAAFRNPQNHEPGT